MGYKDLHDEPFDDSTICKLEIFEDYAQAWIPTFLNQSHFSEIHIFDFFAGTGYDKNGVEGSPIRILEKLKDHRASLFQNTAKVIVHLNEFEPRKKIQNKYKYLMKACSEFMNGNKLSSRVDVRYYNQDFEILFPKLLTLIKGVKKYFSNLVFTIPKTYFVSKNGRSLHSTCFS